MVQKRCDTCGNIHECTGPKHQYYIHDSIKKTLSSYIIKNGFGNTSNEDEVKEPLPSQEIEDPEQQPSPISPPEPLPKTEVMNNEQTIPNEEVMNQTDLDNELQKEFNNKVIPIVIQAEEPELFEDKIKQQPSTSPKKKKKWTNYSKTKPWENQPVDEGEQKQ